MNIKNACTVVLLAFIAASIAVLLGKSLRQASPPAAENRRDRLIVCCFHGAARCSACTNIEAYAHEAVAEGFPAELSDGRIEWRTLDFEQPENRQLAEEYGVLASSVVLVEMRGGERRQSYCRI